MIPVTYKWSQKTIFLTLSSGVCIQSSLMFSKSNPSDYNTILFKNIKLNSNLYEIGLCSLSYKPKPFEFTGEPQDYWINVLKIVEIKSTFNFVKSEKH